MFQSRSVLKWFLNAIRKLDAIDHSKTGQKRLAVPTLKSLLLEWPGFRFPTVLHYKTMTNNFSPDHSRRWSLGLQKRLSSSQISHWLWPLGLLMSWLGPGLLRHLWPGLLLWYLWSRLVCRLRSWLLGSLRFGLVSRLWLGLLRCLWPRLLWWLGPGLLLLLGWTGRRHSQFWIDSQFHQALLLLHLKIITIQIFFQNTETRDHL